MTNLTFATVPSVELERLDRTPVEVEIVAALQMAAHVIQDWSDLLFTGRLERRLCGGDDRTQEQNQQDHQADANSVWIDPLPSRRYPNANHHQDQRGNEQDQAALKRVPFHSRS